MPNVTQPVPGGGAFTFQCPECDETTVAFFPSWPFRFRCYACQTLWLVRRMETNGLIWTRITKETPHADTAPS